MAVTLSTQWRDRCSGGGSASEQESGGDSATEQESGGGKGRQSATSDLTLTCHT